MQIYHSNFPNFQMCRKRSLQKWIWTFLRLWWNSCASSLCAHGRPLCYWIHEQGRRNVSETWNSIFHSIFILVLSHPTHIFHFLPQRQCETRRVQHRNWNRLRSWSMCWACSSHKGESCFRSQAVWRLQLQTWYRTDRVVGRSQHNDLCAAGLFAIVWDIKKGKWTSSLCQGEWEFSITQLAISQQEVLWKLCENELINKIKNSHQMMLTIRNSQIIAVCVYWK